MNIDVNLSKNKLFLIYVISLCLIGLCCFTPENYSSPVKEIIIMLFVIVIGFIAINYMDTNQKDLHKIAFLTIIIFGLMFVFLSPFNAATDEPEHLVRAELTSQDIVFPEYDEENGGFLTIASVTTVPRNSNVFESDWDDSKINFTPVYYNSAFQQNPFFGYIAPALGILFAKLLDFNQIWLLWMGRLFNLLLYAAISAIAIKKSPIMKMPLFIVACLPLAVELGASLNMDALTLSLSLLCIAYFFKLYASKNLITKKDIAKFFILILILSLTKVTLGALSLLILAIPRDKFENKNYLLALFGILVLLAILLGWNKLHGVDSLYHSWRAERFIQKGVNPHLQLDYLLHNPQGIITLLSSFTNIPSVISELNRIYTFYPTFTILSWVYAIFFVIISFIYPIKEKFTNKLKIISLVIILAIYLGVYFVQYLTWAPVGSTNMADFGISTRYFVPFFVLIPVILNINYDDKIKIKYLDKYIITCVFIFLGGLVIYVASLAY